MQETTLDAGRPVGNRDDEWAMRWRKTKEKLGKASESWTERHSSLHLAEGHIQHEKVHQHTIIYVHFTERAVAKCLVRYIRILV